MEVLSSKLLLSYHYPFVCHLTYVDLAHEVLKEGLLNK